MHEYVKHLEALTTEEKTLYAARCVEEYCASSGISHSYIDRFLEHLRSIHSCDSLEEWLDVELDFVGELEEVPPELDAVIPEEYKKDLYRIAADAWWVGGCDICAASSNMPMEFLARIVSIMKKNRMPFPPIDPVRTGKPTRFDRPAPKRRTGKGRR